jgi:hypothetical protein
MYFLLISPSPHFGTKLSQQIYLIHSFQYSTVRNNFQSIKPTLKIEENKPEQQVNYS